MEVSRSLLSLHDRSTSPLVALACHWVRRYLVTDFSDRFNVDYYSSGALSTCAKRSGRHRYRSSGNGASTAHSSSGKCLKWFVLPVNLYNVSDPFRQKNNHNLCYIANWNNHNLQHVWFQVPEKHSSLDVRSSWGHTCITPSWQVLFSCCTTAPNPTEQETPWMKRGIKWRTSKSDNLITQEETEHFEHTWDLRWPPPSSSTQPGSKS